ncbi:MAG: TlpA family protein disulfide reductase [Bacteroidetes bacterium]|nr:TlpA family protein disulfide reductase [Bacteroidota bacterium]
MLLDFSYASCLPCINAIPMLNAVFKKYKPTDLVVHWIDPVDFKDKTFAKGQFAKLGIEFEVLFDEQRYCLSLYNMNTYPETFLVETQTGKIVYHHRGYLVDTGIEKELMNAIDGYLKVH